MDDDTIASLRALRERLREFARARDWEQFHSPKNLAAALIVEAAELLEHFQWLTPEQSERLSPAQRQAVEEEIADVFIYLVRLSDRLGVDLFEAAARKIEKNEKKYPADEVRGKAEKR
jgi:NTP pyrophosphatase (non-canonical NTP hydrolase)